jgi:2-haloacid dehalogenase
MWYNLDVMKFSTILIDLDRTVLDFDTTEALSIEKTFTHFGLPFSKQILQLYISNNFKYWKLYEMGQLTTAQVDIKRFEDTFATMGVTCDIASLSNYYQRCLDAGYELCPNAVEMLQFVKQHFKVYAVTNGAITTQKLRLAGSGIDKYFDGLFISDEIGYSKPQKEFFDHVLANIEETDKSKILLVGDSVATDIIGAKNAGIPTCWYNVTGESLHDMPATYQISDLLELLDIVK